MGLYIHVPFCGAICSYCHFARTADHDPAVRRRFVDGVLAELALRRAACPSLDSGRRPLATAYVGGGTPSQLEPELMERLLAGTVFALPRRDDLELTVEANPETLTPELAAAWHGMGVQRVSLGVQSLDAQVLALLGRRCDPATARRALRLACATFGRVSADWILGPGVHGEALRAELSEAAALGVEHFSLYLLEIHPGTGLAAAVAAGRLPLPSDAAYERLYLEAVDHLAGLGIEQYEVANFARPGAESRHNSSYWTGTPWLGLGPGAHGFWGRRRYENHRDPAAWEAALAAGRLPEGTVDPLDRHARRLERVILALRTRRGVPLDLLPPGALDLAAGRREGWWEVAGGRLALTARGFLRIDAMEQRLADRLLP